MLAKFCQILLLAALANSAAVKDITAEEVYGLPDDYAVSNYDIALTVKKEAIEGTSTTFDGKVTITFTLKNEANNIQLHAPFQTINVKLFGADNKEIDIDSLTPNKVTSILTIKPKTDTLIKQQYKLTISYTGELRTDMTGFYTSTYKDSKGVEQHLVTTQFEPVSARLAFPCFDEPSFKATFTFSIIFPTGYTALFNTNQKSIADKEGMTTVTFETTPKMSTYLVAFTVSKFTSTADKESKEVTYRVWSEPESEKDRSLAQEYGVKILEQLGTVTGIEYKNHGLKKLDQIAIPDKTGAMENYGLVTYSENSLLWNEDESSVIDKQNILSVIAHELAHMWFGDLVTLLWWDYTFLNEGFASFFQYYIIEKIKELETDENWEFGKQFVLDNVQAAFLADSSTSSLALVTNTTTPEEISKQFSTIGYNKGASILQMLYSTIGSDNFLKGIQDYLKSNQQRNTDPSLLWTSLQKQSLTGLLPENKQLADVMDQWINEAGFPVVTVSSEGDNVTLTQKRFLYEGKEDTKWYVPISYATSEGVKDFATTKTWLTPDEDLTIVDALKNAKWIVFNYQESGYYRVNYDSKLWSKIRETLASTDRTQIDVLNRAQIVDDAFNLAKANEMKYSDLLNLINFLKDETDYYPWYSAITGFNSLMNKFAADSEIYKAIKNRQLQLLQNVYKSVPITNMKPDDLVYSRKQLLILNQMCKLGDQSCIEIVSDLFGAVKNGTLLTVNKSYNNLKFMLYCNGLRYSSNPTEDYKFLWERYQKTPYATEKSAIINALGCTKNTEQLKTLLTQSIDSKSGIKKMDLSHIWNSVINSNPEGVDVAYNFYTENYKDIKDYYARSLQVLSTIASAFTKKEQLDKLETFSKQKDLDDSVKTIAETCAKDAKNNLDWVAKIKDDFEVYFDLKGAAIRQLASIFVIVPLLFISMMFVY